MPVSVVCDTAAVTAAIRESIATSSTNGGCSAASDDPQSLQSKLVASAKRVLLTKIEYEEVNNYSQAVLDTLKSKYIVLKPSNSAKLNHSHSAVDKDANQNQCTGGPKDLNHLPHPKKILFARENVQIGWKGSGRKWQVGAGMINVGNTCYLNSTLQALFHVPAMANWLMSDAAHRDKCEDENASQGGCIICAMSKTLMFSQTNQNPIRPYMVYTKLRLVCKHLIMGRQEDAHEFLRYLVEAMEKSYLARHRINKELDQYSKETTPLNQILGGYLKSAVECLSCGHVSTTFQHFQDLLLDIRKANTLEEALDGYFDRERLEDMGYKCEACKKKVTATKQFSLERAPISLCIQLKRFSMFGSKLNKHVAIRPRLDLSPYASKTNRERLSYKLVAMVTHLGASQHCGHYTAIGLTESGAYYQFDDSYVRPISLQNVLNTNAYIIFYELEDSHEHTRQTSTQISREHNDNTLKELSNKLNNQSANNEHSSLRPNATNSTNGPTSNNLSSKLISKLETKPTLIGPQLPGKSSFQRNAPSTAANGDTSKTPQASHGSKLVNSSSPLKLTNGSGFQSPPSQKSNCFNQNLSSKVTIHFKNGPGSSTNSKISFNTTNNNNKQQSPASSKFQHNSNKSSDRCELNGNTNCDKGQSTSNRSTLPSMPKLDDSAASTTPKSKFLPRPSEQPAGKTNGSNKHLTNGFIKSASTSNGGGASNNKSNIKSLVPYESDDDSDDSNCDQSKARNSTPFVQSKGKKRPYESDNESSSSSSSSSDGTPSKMRLTPPSTPTVKTKSGLWQVTDITEPKTSNNSQRKNPFASAMPTVRLCDQNNSNKFSERDKKFANRNGGSAGSMQNGTVQHLLKFSHRGYGAPVQTWNGQKTSIEKEVIEEIRQERKRDLQEEDENEMDRGRQKKVKTNGFIGRDNPGYNPFQEYQTHQNQRRRWNGTPYRPYRPNHHRNHNFRRHHFHKQRPHHQRNGGGGNSFHHRRDS